MEALFFYRKPRAQDQCFTTKVARVRVFADIQNFALLCMAFPMSITIIITKPITTTTNNPPINVHSNSPHSPPAPSPPPAKLVLWGYE